MTCLEKETSNHQETRKISDLLRKVLWNDSSRCKSLQKTKPGSKLKTAVTKKKGLTKREKARRKSFCARSAGQMKKFPKAAKNPNSRLRQARRRWRC